MDDIERDDKMKITGQIDAARVLLAAVEGVSPLIVNAASKGSENQLRLKRFMVVEDGDLDTIGYTDDTPDVDFDHDRQGRTTQVVDGIGTQTKRSTGSVILSSRANIQSRAWRSVPAKEPVVVAFPGITARRRAVGRLLRTGGFFPATCCRFL